MDFELAAVAGTGVDLADGQRPPQRAQDVLLQPRGDDHAVIRFGRRFGLDAGFRDLAENVEHQRSCPL
jgi:hypothetical protein